MKTRTSFRPTVDIWDTDVRRNLHTLQRGQWVKTGPEGARGRYWGIKKDSGVLVVAWQHNAVRSGDYRTYQRALLNYAKA